MPAIVTSARDAIATLVAALVPYDDPNAVYHHFTDADGRYFMAGASTHRCFKMEPIEGGDIHDFGASLSYIQWKIIMRLRENVIDKGDTGLFDHLCTEGINIQRAINTSSSWPAQVDMVYCQKFTFEDAKAYSNVGLGKSGSDSMNKDIVFEIVVRTQET